MPRFVPLIFYVVAATLAPVSRALDSEPPTAAAPAGASAPSDALDPEANPTADDESPFADEPANDRIDEVVAVDDFEADEMKELASELNESFEALHRTRAETEADVRKQIRICSASPFKKRKSLLPRLTGVAKERARGNRSALKAFNADIASLQAQLRAESARRNEANARLIPKVIANFEESCGFSFDRFAPEVIREANRKRIPPETLFSMISMESTGDCFAAVREGGRDVRTGEPYYSRGLFQLHAKFTSLRACTDAQKAEIRGAKSMADLRAGPNCVENPALNLRAAAQILADKARTLVRGTKTFSIYYLASGRQACWRKKRIAIAAFRRGRLQSARGVPKHDLWRMAVSAYNGGEGWVFRAKRNIEAFNSLHGAKVDPYDWNSLKSYYFRRTLSRAQQLRYFGVQERDRDLDYAALNVIYAESAVTGGAKSETLADRWRKRAQTMQRLPARAR